jgi:single-strand DNA-binding protein
MPVHPGCEMWVEEFMRATLPEMQSALSAKPKSRCSAFVRTATLIVRRRGRRKPPVRSFGFAWRGWTKRRSIVTAHFTQSQHARETDMSNRFQGVGNLGAKPELKRIDQNGDSEAVLELRIYFDRRVPGGEDLDSFEDRGGFWITASLWGKRAERAAALLDKGMRVFVTGTLLTDTWLDSTSAEKRTEMRLRLEYLALDLSRVKGLEMEAKKGREVAA